MGGLISLMNTSLSALQADQAALNATSNNVANQNTVGYTREVVNFQTNDLVTLNGATGDGVNIGTGPVSLRDRVLEQRVQQQTQTQSQSAALGSSMEQVQNIFGISSSSTSASATALGTAMDSFFSSLSALASNPSDTAVRQNVLNTANTLAGQFNSAASQLSQTSAGLDQQVGSVVSQVNSLTATIASLNGQISALSPKADAGTLEDQRQAAIAQLSKYIGLNQITTENNGITLTTSGGSVLVSGNASYALTTSQVSGTTHVLDSTGQDITANITGGQLGGVFDARDTQIPSVMSGLDTLANAIATNVNTVNEQGVNAYGSAAGVTLFSVAGGVAGSAVSIAVSTNDPLEIAAAGIGEGSLGNTNAQALADLSTAAIVGGATVSSYYSNFLARVGNTAADATADSTQQQAALTQLTTQRDALSGVSLDEEAANLTQYQRSYQAASQVFNIVNTLMASAINLGVETTVS
jgi:flagellar hook-associated protein 1 FlgK